MDRARRDLSARAGAAAGLAFVALLAASAGVAHAPSTRAPAAEVGRRFASEPGSHLLAAYLVALAGACALVFAVALRARVGGRAGDAALAGGVVAVALIVAGQAAHAALALRERTPEVADALFAAGNALFALAWPALALLVGAGSLELRRPLAAPALLLALWLALVPVAGSSGGRGPLDLAGAIPVVSLALLLLWVATASLVLARRA